MPQKCKFCTFVVLLSYINKKYKQSKSYKNGSTGIRTNQITN